MLQVPLIPQTNPQGRNSCVPACVSMVLAHQGVDLAEDALCDLLDTQSAGTEVWNLLSLEHHLVGSQVVLASASVARLEEALAQGVPPIAFVVTTRLHYWQKDTLHAVVVVEVTPEAVRVNDPAFSDAVRTVAREEFVAAWSEVDFLTALIVVGRAGSEQRTTG